MLGEFLEFSLATDDIPASYAFYTALGFEGLEGSEALGYRYGVVSDGRIAIGLHEAERAPLALTFVHAELARHAITLRRAGVTLDLERLGDESLHEIAIAGPGVQLRLIEARTFSPSHDGPPSLLGRFSELVLTTADATGSGAYFEDLGFVGMHADAVYSVSSAGLTIRFAETGVRQRPALCFECADLGAVDARLRALGFAPLADPGDDGAAIRLRAPEGTLLRIGAGDP